MKHTALTSRIALFGLVSALVLWPLSPAFANHGALLVLEVAADDVTTFNQVPSPDFPLQGPFYIAGDIFKSGDLGGTPIGRFHCWGWAFQDDGLGVVAQEFDLFDRGKIQVQGIEDEGPRAVTGGTGDFLNVRGEMTGSDLSAFPDFTVTFRLIGAHSDGD